MTDQPPPVPNNLPAIWDLVIADMRERDRIGTKRYGTRLQPHNGRDALVDAYQESLDQCAYLRQAIYERDQRRQATSWTTTPPTEYGLYWWRSGGVKQAILIHSEKAWFPGIEKGCSIEELGGEWQPVAEPEEASPDYIPPVQALDVFQGVAGDWHFVDAAPG